MNDVGAQTGDRLLGLDGGIIWELRAVPVMTGIDLLLRGRRKTEDKRERNENCRGRMKSLLIRSVALRRWQGMAGQGMDVGLMGLMVSSLYLTLVRPNLERELGWCVLCGVLRGLDGYGT